MKHATDAFISDESSYRTPGALHEGLRGTNARGTVERFGTCANAALLWWSQGGPSQNPVDPNGYLALAKYCINHVEEFYANSFGCDKSQRYCGRSVSSDGDYAGMRLHNVAITYTIVRSLGIDTPNGLTNAEVRTFSNKLLNDRDSTHNGLDISDCETDGRGIQAMTIAESTTVAVAADEMTVTFSTPTMLPAGTVLLPFPPTVYKSAIGILKQPVNNARTGVLTLPAADGWSGRFYMSPPNSGNTCGILWVQKHSDVSPPIGSNPSAYQRDYSSNAGTYAGATNLGFAHSEGYLSIALALADDDSRARTLLSQVYGYYVSQQLGWALSVYNGLNTAGPAYMWDRQGFVLPSMALMVRNSVVDGPSLSGPNVIRNAGRTAYYWRLPWSNPGYQPAPWGASSDYEQGYGIPAKRGVPTTYQWLIANGFGDEAAYLSQYMSERGDFEQFQTNRASYASFAFMFWDPSSAKRPLAELPRQYRFTSDYAFCRNLAGATCEDKGWDHVVSKTGWGRTDTILTIHGGHLLGGDHTETLNGGAYHIGRNTMMLAGDSKWGIGGPPGGSGAQNDNLLSVGTDSDYGIFGDIHRNVATPAIVFRWAGKQNVGDALSRYTYTAYNVAPSFKPAANVTRARRHIAHLKGGKQDYIVSYDDVAVSSATGLRSFWHYTRNGLPCSAVVTTFDQNRRTVITTQTSSRLVSAFLPVSGSGIAMTRDAGDFSYPTGAGFTCRVTTCASTDGGSCASDAKSFEQIAIHMPVASSSGSMPVLSQLNGGGLWAVVQIADSDNPKVAAFTRQGTLQTSLSVSTTHAGAAQYLIAGLVSGTYNVTVNGVSVLVGQSVFEGDTSLYFESSSGVVSIVRVGARSEPDLSACDINRSGSIDVLDVSLLVNQVLANTCSSAFDITEDGVCNALDVSRIMDAALGGSCRVGR